MNLIKSTKLIIGQNFIVVIAGLFGPQKLNNSIALELGKLWVLETSRREIHKNLKRIKLMHSPSDDSSDNEDNDYFCSEDDFKTFLL